MITTDLNRAEFDGDNSQTVFVFRDTSSGTNIPVVDQSHIKVYVDSTLKTITTHYTVAIASKVATITFTSGNTPPTGTKNILFIREVPFQQNTDLANNSQLDAESLESQLDNIVNQAQQLNDKTSRNLRFADTLTEANATETHATLTVTSASRANKALKFDGNGNLTVSTLNIDAVEDSVLDAKSYATESGANVKEYTDGSGSATSDYSSKEWATGSTVSDGSAKEWATKTTAVSGSLYSSKEYAQSATAGTDTYGGSAKGWASTPYDTAIPGAGSGDRSALHYATDASNSATAANASADAVATFLEAFDNKYLGSMSNTSAQGTNPTNIACSWTKNSSTITVASKTNMKVGQVVTGTGMPTPAPSIISISPSANTVVVSDNMDAASGGNQNLTFTGYGVYGTYDGTKLGPSKDNNNGNLTDGLLYFNTTNDVIMVYDDTTSKWKQITPTSASQTAIDTLVNGTDGTTGTSGTTKNIALVNTLVPELDHIGLLGVASVVSNMALLGTSAVTTSLSVIGTGYDGTANTSGTNTNMTQIDVCADNIDALNTVATNAEGNAISMAIALG